MKLLRRGILGLAGLAILALLVRTFVLRVYYVDSPSMEPYLHGAAEGGDRALVVFGSGSEIKRGDVVVILPSGEDEPLVKRVLGLPGESVALRNGDVWIDGEILRTDVDLAVPVLIFDSAHDDFEIAFRVPKAWLANGTGWTVEAANIEPDDLAGCSFMRLGLKDHYMDPTGKLIPGRDAVGDALLQCQLEMDQPGFVARLGLVERGDRFELLIQSAPENQASVRLLRGVNELYQGDVDWSPGPHRLRFGNVNNRLSFEMDGKRILTHDYASNTNLPSDSLGLGRSPESDRVYLGGHSGVGRFSEVRVFRDLHYTPMGQFAVKESVPLGPTEIFLLGDNSRQSRDGREWGPTPLAEVIGRPVAVVWPPERMRNLDPAPLGQL